MCSIGEIFLRWKFWYTVVVCLQSGNMDVQGTRKPWYLVHPVDRARNLAAMDAGNRGTDSKVNDILAKLNSKLDSLVNVVLPSLMQSVEAAACGAGIATSAISLADESSTSSADSKLNMIIDTNVIDVSNDAGTNSLRSMLDCTDEVSFDATNLKLDTATDNDAYVGGVTNVGGDLVGSGVTIGAATAADADVDSYRIDSFNVNISASVIDSSSVIDTTYPSGNVTLDGADTDTGTITGILVTNVEGNLTGGTVNAAHFGKCDKGDACRSSHKEGDLADLKQDPRFKEWKSKLSPDDTSRFHALECDNANLQQEVNHQAELLFR